MKRLIHTCHTYQETTSHESLVYRCYEWYIFRKSLAYPISLGFGDRLWIVRSVAGISISSLNLNSGEYLRELILWFHMQSHTFTCELVCAVYCNSCGTEGCSLTTKRNWRKQPARRRVTGEMFEYHELGWLTCDRSTVLCQNNLQPLSLPITYAFVWSAEELLQLNWILILGAHHLSIRSQTVPSLHIYRSPYYYPMVAW